MVTVYGGFGVEYFAIIWGVNACDSMGLYNVAVVWLTLAVSPLMKKTGKGQFVPIVELPRPWKLFRRCKTSVWIHYFLMQREIRTRPYGLIVFVPVPGTQRVLPGWQT